MLANLPFSPPERKDEDGKEGPSFTGKGEEGQRERDKRGEGLFILPFLPFAACLINIVLLRPLLLLSSPSLLDLPIRVAAEGNETAVALAVYYIQYSTLRCSSHREEDEQDVGSSGVLIGHACEGSSRLTYVYGVPP